MERMSDGELHEIKAANTQKTTRNQGRKGNSFIFNFQ
jgi:hypothetical protein